LDQDKIDEAIKHLQHAVRIEPQQVLPRYDLGLAFIKRGDLAEAAEQFRTALSIDPNHTATHLKLGVLLTDSGQAEQAVKHFAAVVRRQPDNPQAHTNLAKVLQRAGQTDRAIDHYQRALELAVAEEAVSALTGLSWLLAIHENPAARDPQRAIRLATKAVALTNRREPLALDALAAAHAANRDYDAAVAAAEEALDLAAKSVRIELAEHIRNRLERYRQGKPFVRPARPVAPDAAAPRDNSRP